MLASAESRKCVPSRNRPLSRGARPAPHRHLQGLFDAHHAGKAVLQWLASCLFADSQFLNHNLVAFGIGLSEVVQQAASPVDHHEKTAPGGMVLLMRLKMLRQFTNPLTQDRDLHFWRPGIRVVGTVLVNYGGFFLSG